MAAVVCAVVPASAAKMGVGCSSENLTKTETAVDAMADGESRTLSRGDLERGAWNWADPFRGLGLFELVVKPLPHGAALVVGTRCPEGFTERDLTTLARLAESLGDKQSGSNRLPRLRGLGQF